MEETTSSMEEQDNLMTTNIAERFGESLLPLMEDLADWLSKVLQEELKAENFIDYLDDGVLVCKLAQVIQKVAEDCNREGSKGVNVLPPFTMKFHKNAKAGTFFARDNAAYFLQWCKHIGVQDSVMFESDGLVLHKQPREVVLCLLDVARIAATFGIEPPGLIKLEREIDDEVAEGEGIGKKIVHAKPIKVKKASKGFTIDQEVSRLAAKYNVKIERIKEGRYVVDGKINIFVRILRNHVMVRVGGGWDTLEHFISRHDPNKLGKILTSTPSTCDHHHYGLAASLSDK